jgi:energy-converting hydrogenase Eha subunit G
VVVPTIAGYLSAALLLAGLSVYLHTVMSIKVAAAPPMNLTGNVNRLRFALKEWLDTPIFLLMLCLLRAWPELLLLYVVSYGLLSLARAASLAKLRLARA